MSRYIDADSLAKKIMRAWELWDKKGEDCFVFSDIVTPIMVNEPTADVVEQTRWIPVSERLPEEDGCYLVTTTGTNNDIIDIAYYTDGIWHKASRIKAWMPLPEPYKAE